jgi:hypothetical protein
MGRTHPERKETCSERRDEEPFSEKFEIHQRGRRSKFHKEKKPETEQKEEKPCP